LRILYLLATFPHEFGEFLIGEADFPGLVFAAEVFEVVVAVDVDKGELAVQNADFLLLALGIEGVCIHAGGVAPEHEDRFALRVGTFHPGDAAAVTLGENGKSNSAAASSWKSSASLERCLSRAADMRRRGL